MHPAHRTLGLVVVMLGLGAPALGGCGGAEVGAPEKSQDPSSSGSLGTTDPATDAGAAPAQDSVAQDAATTTTTGKPLGETCAQNSDCESAECFVGGQFSYCSLLCTMANAATVCVAPFAGVCNNRGYCKK